MPRSNNVYTLPPGTDGVPNATISSSAYNSLIHDIETDLNTPRPIVAGGTGANNAADARTNLGITTAIDNAVGLNCGRFYYIDSTHVGFLPYNGDRVKIQGVTYAIPAGGVTAVINNCFLNSVAGQTLVAGTVYLVCVFNNAGTLALDFLTTLAHSADTTAGNVGVETSTSNKSRTVVGMVSIGGGPVFLNTTVNRMVISWFNRRNLNLRGASTGGSGTSSSTPIEINTATRVAFLNWADDDVQFGITGAFLSTGAGTGGWQIGYDLTPIGLISNQTLASGSWWGAVTTQESFNSAEGAHNCTVMGTGNGVTMNFYAAVVGTIRG